MLQTRIMQAQFSYERRHSHPLYAQIGTFVRCLGLAVAIVWSLLIVGYLSHIDNRVSISLFYSFASLFQLATLIAFIVLNIHTLITATHSLTRERANGTLELLLLTHADARDIIHGKWKAIVRQQLHAYISVSLMIICSVVTQQSLNNVYILQVALQRGGQIIIPSPLMIAVSVVLVWAGLILSLPLAAACGLYSAALGQSEPVAILRSFATRIAIHVLPLGIFYVLIAILGGEKFIIRSHPENGFQLLINVLIFFIINVAEYGIQTLSTILRIQFFLTADRMALYELNWPHHLVPALMLMNVYFGLITYFVLRLGQRRLIQQGASPVIQMRHQKRQ